jgi:hypothetical protein
VREDSPLIAVPQTSEAVLNAHVDQLVAATEIPTEVAAKTTGGANNKNERLPS